MEVLSILIYFIFLRLYSIFFLASEHAADAKFIVRLKTLIY
jgi:hypothetical protein